MKTHRHEPGKLQSNGITRQMENVIRNDEDVDTGSSFDILST